MQQSLKIFMKMHLKSKLKNKGRKFTLEEKMVTSTPLKKNTITFI